MILIGVCSRGSLFLRFILATQNDKEPSGYFRALARYIVSTLYSHCNMYHDWYRRLLSCRISSWHPLSLPIPLGQKWSANLPLPPVAGVSSPPGKQIHSQAWPAGKGKSCLRHARFHATLSKNTFPPIVPMDCVVSNASLLIHLSLIGWLDPLWFFSSITGFPAVLWEVTSSEILVNFLAISSLIPIFQNKTHPKAFFFENKIEKPNPDIL